MPRLSKVFVTIKASGAVLKDQYVSTITVLWAAICLNQIFNAFMCIFCQVLMQSIALFPKLIANESDLYSIYIGILVFSTHSSLALEVFHFIDPVRPSNFPTFASCIPVPVSSHPQDQVCTAEPLYYQFSILIPVFIHLSKYLTETT